MDSREKTGIDNEKIILMYDHPPPRLRPHRRCPGATLRLGANPAPAYRQAALLLQASWASNEQQANRGLIASEEAERTRNRISAGAYIVKQQPPTVEALMLTVFDDNDKVFQAVCAGASGYLLKKTPPSKILEAIEDVYNGGAPMTPVIARKLLQLFPRTPAVNTETDKLTPANRKCSAASPKAIATKWSLKNWASASKQCARTIKGFMENCTCIRWRRRLRRRF